MVSPGVHCSNDQMSLCASSDFDRTLIVFISKDDDANGQELKKFYICRRKNVLFTFHFSAWAKDDQRDDPAGPYG